jgi:hypothetical protein
VIGRTATGWFIQLLLKSDRYGEGTVRRAITRLPVWHRANESFCDEVTNDEATSLMRKE